MSKQIGSKNIDVFSDVITSLASDAASDVEGIRLLRAESGKKFLSRGNGVSVYFLPNEKVAIDLFVEIKQGYTVPRVVAAVQEKVKDEVEKATKYRVHSVNVQVVSIDIEE